MQLSRIDRATKSMLFRVGGLDSLNGLGVVPPEFEYVDNRNFYVGRSVPSPASTTPAFTAVDAGALAASAYDELVIDTQPVVTSSGEVSTNGGNTPELYRSILISNTPFWFVVRCTGYGQSSLYTRDSALAVAKRVAAALWADANAFMLTPLLRGFAFVSPDLNVVFPDGTAIDRPFQSALVQQAWSTFRAAMVITSRPNDCISLVAPQFAPPVAGDPGNPNSGVALPWPILGNSPQFADKIVALYPNVALGNPSLSLVAAQVQSFFSAKARDAGFPLNLSYGYVLPIDWTAWSPDGSVGSAVTGDALSRLNRLSRFVAATGVTSFGVQSGPTGVAVPTPQDFLPEDDLVNTSGGCSMWSAAGVTYVSYIGTDGTRVVRSFTSDFAEVAA